MVDSVMMARTKYNPVIIQDCYDEYHFDNDWTFVTLRLAAKKYGARFFILNKEKLSKSNGFNKDLFYIALHEFYGWDYSDPDNSTIILMINGDNMYGGISVNNKLPDNWVTVGTTYGSKRSIHSVYVYADGIIKKFKN